jgi:hypothetical protein
MVSDVRGQSVCRIIFVIAQIFKQDLLELLVPDVYADPLVVNIFAHCMVGFETE